MKKTIIALIIAIATLITGCSSVSAEQAQQVKVSPANYYGWLDGQYVFEIEDFLHDCGATMTSINGVYIGDRITGTINGHDFVIASAEQKDSDSDATRVITQFSFPADNKGDYDYVVGWLPNDQFAPNSRVVYLVESSFMSTFPRRRIPCDEATLQRLTTVMNSGALLSDSADPLSETHIQYAKMSKYGTWEEFGA